MNNDNQLWQEFGRYRGWSLRKAAGLAATFAGLGALLAVAWTAPGTEDWPAWAKLLLAPLRAVLLVESFGYLYHRFFQHVGVLTRHSGVIRRNQMFHWTHHMIIYPIGRFYQRNAAYITSETGLALSWVVPGWIAAGLAVATMGLNAVTLAFLAGVGVYAKFVIDLTHARFHLKEHPWIHNRYFRWLEEIHLLHHWDQEKNFTIVHPAMDWLFGTYLAPRKHRRELRIALEDRELTVSDMTNWRYLLKEATPAEYAAFISQAKKHPRSVRKLDLLIALCERRLEKQPADVEALDLFTRASDLLRLVKPLQPAL